MDFTDQDVQSQSAVPKKSHDRNKWGRVGIASLVVALAILLVAVVILIGFSGNKNEDRYVDTSKLQAVFLNNGRVYFGNITAINSQYLVLTNVYYLQATGHSTKNSTNSAKSNSNSTNGITVAKLGCQQLHAPYSQMVINSGQVAYWENLQSSGKVATEISNFQKNNPNGPNCSDQSSSTISNSAAIDNIQ